MAIQEKARLIMLILFNSYSWRGKRDAVDSCWIQDFLFLGRLPTFDVNNKVSFLLKHSLESSMHASFGDFDSRAADAPSSCWYLLTVAQLQCICQATLVGFQQYLCPLSMPSNACTSSSVSDQPSISDDLHSSMYSLCTDLGITAKSCCNPHFNSTYKTQTVVHLTRSRSHLDG